MENRKRKNPPSDMRGFIIDLLYALSPPHPFMCAPCTIIYGKDIERIRKMIFIR